VKEGTMKKILFLALFISSTLVMAEDKKSEWNATTLTEATIKKIQSSQYEYKKCVMLEMQKKGYAKIESRSATDAIVKQCEKVLAHMRKVYLDVKVPAVIADRHLKKMRMTMTRRVLKQMMFAEAARKAGQ
jgi:hypothetical protein